MSWLSASTKVGAPLLFFKRERKGRIDYGDVLREVMPRAPHLQSIVDLADPPLTGTHGFAAFLARGTTVTDEELHRRATRRAAR